MGKTIFEKIWGSHLVTSITDGPDVLYIDKHFVHEVTSPQAFTGLEKRGLKVFRPQRVVVTADHNVPTLNQHLPIVEELSRMQVNALIENCKKNGLELYGLGHPFQGIVHVIGPELGITQPGMTIVCGDSHTSTHGAFGCIAFGIGTSEVEMVLATQCLLQTKPKTMRICIEGKLQKGVTAKDIILYILSKLSASGGTGYFVEFCGSAITGLSMEGRMTLCNMSIELGAKGGLVAPDEVTFEYLKGRQFTPSGSQFEKAKKRWQSLFTDKDAVFGKEYTFSAEDIEPMVTFGTNPGMGIKISEQVPALGSVDASSLPTYKQALDYMGIEPGASLKGHRIDWVFLGSCTNGRIEDLRDFAKLVKGKKKAPYVKDLIVPGSKQVEKQAIAEGLDKILIEAGFTFRQPGCSACLAMNEDKIPEKQYCISTSNRNFEGRQGQGARTILASPLTAAASAITGYVTDPREFI